MTLYNYKSCRVLIPSSRTPNFKINPSKLQCHTIQYKSQDNVSKGDVVTLMTEREQR